jgi:hypothetical protein
MKIKTVVGIGITLLTIIAVVLTQVVATQPLSDDDLKQQLVNLDSFSAEVLLILDQYEQDKLSLIYVNKQAEQIYKDVSDFYSLLESKAIPENKQDKAASVEKLVSQFALQLKRMESAEANPSQLNKVRQAIQQLRDQITESEQRYA